MIWWKKVLLWTIGVLVVVVGGCAALLHRVGSGMCDNVVIDQIHSPSGTLKAVVYQIDCGATTGFNSHVSIVPGDVDASKADSLPRSFFVVDSNKEQVPAGIGGGPEVRIAWKNDTHLEIRHHELVRIIRAEGESNGVSVVYSAFR